MARRAGRQPLAGIARSAKIDLVFVHRGAAQAYLLDQCSKGAAERHQFPQLVATQQRQRRFEEGFRGSIGTRDRPSGETITTGCGKCVEHGIGRARNMQGSIACGRLMPRFSHGR